MVVVAGLIIDMCLGLTAATTCSCGSNKRPSGIPVPMPPRPKPRYPQWSVETDPVHVVEFRKWERHGCLTLWAVRMHASGWEAWYFGF